MGLSLYASGPWSHGNSGLRSSVAKIMDSNGKILGYVGPNANKPMKDDERAKAEANAKLIAAAPDMLKTLLEVEKCLENSSRDIRILTEVRRAIGSATLG